MIDLKQLNTYLRKAGITATTGKNSKYTCDSLSDLTTAVNMVLSDQVFASVLAADPTAPKTIQTVAQAVEVCWRYVYKFLHEKDYESAAQVLWSPDVFTTEPRFVKLIWGGIKEKSLVNVMGCASAGKTYSATAWLLLDWLVDPEWTCTLLVGPDMTHLSNNLFGDLVRLHEGSAIPLPGKVDSEGLSTNKLRGMGFFLIALDRGEKISAKLKGYKTKPRGEAHPIFGHSSRLRLIIDEAQQVPVNAWDMILNFISNKESEEHLKVICAANPSDEYSRYGINCKPNGGWTKITKLQERWTSDTGWEVIRLNAVLSENFKAKKVIYARMISYDKVMAIIKASGGDDEAPQVYTQVYGMFPPHGAMSSIISRTWLDRSVGEWLFTGPTIGYGAFDPAFTGDLPAFAYGRTGYAKGWVGTDGQIHMIEGKWVLQIDGVGILARGDTQDLADQLFSRIQILKIKPENFAIDRTGAGQGVHDIMRRQWRVKVDNKKGEDAGDIVDICGIHFAESPSDVKIASEDTTTPKDDFDRIATELWYAAAKYFELDAIRINKGVDGKTMEELSARRGGASTKTSRRRSVEGKDAYKARGHASPDRADAVTMVIHVARTRDPNLLPKLADTPDEVQNTMTLDSYAKQGLEVVAMPPNFRVDLRQDAGDETAGNDDSVAFNGGWKWDD